MYVEPPSADSRRDERLAGAMACLDGSISVCNDRLADLFLLAPDLLLEHVADPLTWSVQVGRGLREQVAERGIDGARRQHIGGEVKGRVTPLRLQRSPLR